MADSKCFGAHFRVPVGSCAGPWFCLAPPPPPLNGASGGAAPAATPRGQENTSPFFLCSEDASASHFFPFFLCGFNASSNCSVHLLLTSDSRKICTLPCIIDHHKHSSTANYCSWPSGHTKKKKTPGVRAWSRRWPWQRCVSTLLPPATRHQLVEG